MDVDLHDSLDGQTALVTGASRGIGERIAADLAGLGATVYAGAREPDDVEATGCRPCRLDVTDAGGIEAALGRIGAEAGGLDVLVNNAAVYGPGGRLGSLDATALEATLRVDLLGPMLVTRAALGLMGAGARVVNVSSGAGQFDGGIDPSHLPYSVAKAGLNAFTDGLAAQYSDRFVNAACPGWVRTDMGGSSAPRGVGEGADTPVWLARFRSGPSGRLWRDRSVVPW